MKKKTAKNPNKYPVDDKNGLQRVIFKATVTQT